MADEENLGPEKADPHQDLATPTQDDLPELISTLAPGVSASGVLAAASALKGISVPSSLKPPAKDGVDEISDEELHDDEDLGDLALKPVERAESDKGRSSRLSNISSISNSSKNQDDVSLSGLSSNDRLQIRSDVEDGEIIPKLNAPEQANNHKKADHSDDSESGLDKGHSAAHQQKSKRRFRKRTEQSDDDLEADKRSRSRDNGRKSSTSPRSFSVLHSSSRKSTSRPKTELPRYDVRNVINRKRAARKGRSRSRSSESRSRSPTASSRKTANHSKRLSKRSRSRSPRRNRSPKGFRARNRKSGSPPRRKTTRRDRSWSRSRSRSPSKNSRRRNRSLSPAGDKSSKKTNNKRSRLTSVSSHSKKKSKSRSRSRSPKGGKKNKKKKTNRSVIIEPDEPSSSSGKKAKKAKKNKRRSADEVILFNTNSIADKEVFTSGDKIMVSVNFKNAANKSAAEIAATKKPTMVIDVMSSPYQVLEPSPEPVFDVLSDEEKSTKKDDEVGNKQPAPQAIVAASTSESIAPPNSIVGDKKANDESDNDDFDDEIIQHIESHKGPCTPPIGDNHQSLDLAKGPQTPTDDPMESYDPCNPTESPNDDINADDDEVLLNSDSSSSSIGHFEDAGNSLLKSAASTIPFLIEDSLIKRLEKNGKSTADNEASNSYNNNTNNDSNDLPVDMDMDSPFSPKSSEGSDIFEPPSMFNTPRKKGGKTNGTSKEHHGKGAKKKAGKGSNKQHLHTKVVDDKLKIIDDVPTSAVEMVVKEKFLKKVQRQERIVEEIKTVLKPYYNRKRITKEDYKDILRKCVPKVCHSKKGDINPTKIQKLVKGYVRKYHHSRKKMMSS